jgi:hypothetical protein
MKMENVKGSRTMTFEEMLADPEFAQAHEGLRYLQRTPPNELFPEKYEKSMIGLALTDTNDLFQENPDMPLKTVVSTVIASFDDDLSADLILKMTPEIIDKWHTLSATSAAQMEVLAA